MKKVIQSASIILIGFLVFACSKTHPPVSRTQLLLGTFVTITDYDSTLQKSIIDAAFDSAFQAIAEIEAMTNPYDSQSAIGKINRRSQEQTSFPIAPPLYSILSSAKEISQKTGGRFDFTVWPVFKLWNFGTDSARVPQPNQIERALPRVNHRNVELDSNLLVFKMPGMEIDLGGIVKGYAVEVARRILIDHGLRDFIIDAGGNLGVEWHKRVAVNIKVRHPRKEGEFWCQFPVDSSVGIATSGDYQYYFVENDRRYHHILEPQSGYPAAPTVSTTIVAPDAIRADGYSTAVFVMGPVKGAEFIQSHPRLEGIIVFPMEGKLETYVSSGLKDAYLSVTDEK